jgi:hypothetical protein
MWLVALQNQLKAWIDAGLLYFSEGGDIGATSDPATWPRLSVSPDMGSDGANLTDEINGVVLSCVVLC